LKRLEQGLPGAWARALEAGLSSEDPVRLSTEPGWIEKNP
jgi:hypothetical protein